MQYQHRVGSNASVVGFGGEDDEKVNSEGSTCCRLPSTRCTSRAAASSAPGPLTDVGTCVPCWRDHPDRQLGHHRARGLFPGRGARDGGTPRCRCHPARVGHHAGRASLLRVLHRRINKCISYACANGEVAPFVGHNVFLHWRAVQDAAVGQGRSPAP
ncbi:uncharacterized protein B0H18DRAFT_893610 [Fomitopsis serialis]|uniref:uncharacterized protein n=1 Tax=Fomitopsis serialis TaxID=139415 RepID=UPI0020080037|nr:uncharacterized protein B0H18DRAFT_893610 [Neoantrodia serialis]KAH9911071.1 hypothetical protein B0H18DRAFT_893610 [Neoantrodia serialis]